MNRGLPRPYAYPPRRLRAPEAARYVGLSETAFLGLALPSVRIGGTVGWLIEDLDAFLDGLRTTPKPSREEPNAWLKDPFTRGRADAEQAAQALAEEIARGGLRRGRRRSVQRKP
jgi:hypothetical protein